MQLMTYLIPWRGIWLPDMCPADPVLVVERCVLVVEAGVAWRDVPLVHNRVVGAPRVTLDSTHPPARGGRPFCRLLLVSLGSPRCRCRALLLPPLLRGGGRRAALPKDRIK